MRHGNSSLKKGGMVMFLVKNPIMFKRKMKHKPLISNDYNDIQDFSFNKVNCHLKESVRSDDCWEQI